jgi:glutamine cyclotransferase
MVVIRLKGPGRRSWAAFMFLFFSASTLTPVRGSGPPPPIYGYRVIKVFPHDPEAFTQGLVYHQGFFYEGTGLYGRSTLRKVEVESGRVLQTVRLPETFFGEGVTVWKDRIVQLTWRNRIGLVYDLKTFRLLKRFPYRTEGWGLTRDDRHLIMSDGTPNLYYLDPESFREVRRIEVRDQGGPVAGLNELETVQGEIWANVWPTDRIVRIAPEDGKVKGWLDLSGLSVAERDPSGMRVLNGIAYDPERDRLWVTGKNWPHLFEIRPMLPP